MIPETSEFGVPIRPWNEKIGGLKTPPPVKKSQAEGATGIFD